MGIIGTYNHLRQLMQIAYINQQDNLLKNNASAYLRIAEISGSKISSREKRRLEKIIAEKSNQN